MTRQFGAGRVAADREKIGANGQVWMLRRGYEATTMETDEKFADIRLLARMAARLAGRDPDESIVVKAGGVVTFHNVAWRYPDFMERAEAAYQMLGSGVGF